MKQTLFFGLILFAWAQSHSWNFFVSLFPTNLASAGQPIDTHGPSDAFSMAVALVEFSVIKDIVVCFSTVLSFVSGHWSQTQAFSVTRHSLLSETTDPSEQTYLTLVAAWALSPRHPQDNRIPESRRVQSKTILLFIDIK
jgi:hypothetical protein